MLSRDFKTSHFVVFNILARYYVMDAALEVGDSSSSQEEEKEPSSKKRYLYINNYQEFTSALHHHLLTDFKT